jgi:hypothetical protein
MVDLQSIARWVLLAGLLLIVFGAILWLLAGSGIPLGRLPGDFRFERAGFSCFIPLASTILVSIVLTLIINLIIRVLK